MHYNNINLKREMPPQQSWHMQTLGIHSKKKLKNKTHFAAFGSHSVQCCFFTVLLPPSPYTDTQRQVGMMWVRSWSCISPYSWIKLQALLLLLKIQGNKISTNSLSCLLTQVPENEHKLSKSCQSKRVGKKWFTWSGNCFRGRQYYYLTSILVTSS